MERESLDLTGESDFEERQTHGSWANSHLHIYRRDALTRTWRRSYFAWDSSPNAPSNVPFLPQKVFPILNNKEERLPPLEVVHNII